MEGAEDGAVPGENGEEDAHRAGQAGGERAGFGDHTGVGGLESAAGGVEVQVVGGAVGDGQLQLWGGDAVGYSGEKVQCDRERCG